MNRIVKLDDIFGILLSTAALVTKRRPLLQQHRRVQQSLCSPSRSVPPDLMVHIIYVLLLTNESFAFSLGFTSAIPPNAVISETLRSIKPIFTVQKKSEDKKALSSLEHDFISNTIHNKIGL